MPGAVAGEGSAPGARRGIVGLSHDNPALRELVVGLRGIAAVLPDFGPDPLDGNAWIRFEEALCDLYGALLALDSLMGEPTAEPMGEPTADPMAPPVAEPGRGERIRQRALRN